VAGVGDGGRDDEVLEGAQITAFSGDPESLCEVLLLCAARRTILRDRDVLAGATHELTGVCFADPQQTRNPRVRVVERLAKDERSTLGRRQSPKHEPDPGTHGLGALGFGRR